MTTAMISLIKISSLQLVLVTMTTKEMYLMMTLIEMLIATLPKVQRMVSKKTIKSSSAASRKLSQALKLCLAFLNLLKLKIASKTPKGKTKSSYILNSLNQH